MTSEKMVVTKIGHRNSKKEAPKQKEGEKSNVV